MEEQWGGPGKARKKLAAQLLEDSRAMVLNTSPHPMTKALSHCHDCSTALTTIRVYKVSFYFGFPCALSSSFLWSYRRKTLGWLKQWPPEGHCIFR